MRNAQPLHNVTFRIEKSIVDHGQSLRDRLTRAPFAPPTEADMHRAIYAAGVAQLAAIADGSAVVALVKTKSAPTPPVGRGVPVLDEAERERRRAKNARDTARRQAERAAARTIVPPAPEVRPEAFGTKIDA